jgi:RNA polymerase sigma factor (sigma-70 family)
VAAGQEVSVTAATAPRLERLWQDHAPAVHAYVRRREPELADEVCAETFAIAWRRLGDVPADARPWLIGVARNVLRTARRAAGRRAALSERLVAELPPVPVEPLDDPDLGGMLARLGEVDRELVLLVYWDGLSPAEAASVVGIRPAAARTRLWRARGRLRTLLLVGVALLLIGGGLALAGALGVRYFDSAAAVPDAARAALKEEAAHYGYPGPRRQLDVEHALVAYDVGDLAVYVAPYATDGGWCGIAYRRDVELGADCVPVPSLRAGTSVALALRFAVTSWSWKNGPVDDARAILGRLPPGAQDTAVQVRFEDRTTAAMTVSDGWFAYVVGPDNMVAGHRPIGLEAGDGASSRIDPFTFNPRSVTTAAARSRAETLRILRDTPVGGASRRRSARFVIGGGGLVNGYLLLAGGLPPGVARVSLRLGLYSERDADLVGNRLWYVWLEPDVYDVPGHQPAELVGRDAAGTVVTTTPLVGTRCKTALCRDLP